MARIPFTSTEASLRGRVGAYTTLARHDPTAQTAHARDVYRASFLDHSACEVCGYPPPVAADLGPRERERRAEALRRAHMARLNLMAVRARAAGSRKKAIRSAKRVIEDARGAADSDLERAPRTRQREDGRARS